MANWFKSLFKVTPLAPSKKSDGVVEVNLGHKYFELNRHKRAVEIEMDCGLQRNVFGSKSINIEAE